MTVEFAPTATFDVSENDVAVRVPLNVTTPAPIVTASNVGAGVMSAVTVMAEVAPLKSTALPAVGATPLHQLPGVDIRPSPAAPVQTLPSMSVSTARYSVSPFTW